MNEVLTLEPHVRTQVRKIQELKFFSTVLFLTLLGTLLLSLCIQLYGSYERGIGRDIHTNIYLLSIHVADIVTQNHVQVEMNVEHTFLKKTLVEGKTLFLSSEKIYTTLLLPYRTNSALIQVAAIHYLSMLSQLYELYTAILSESNTDSGRYTLLAFSFEIGLVLLFILCIYFPILAAVRKSYERYAHVKQEIQEIADEIPLYSFHVDVAKISETEYVVSGNKNKTYVVRKRPDGMFFCQCAIFKHAHFCFHVLRVTSVQREKGTHA